MECRRTIWLTLWVLGGALGCAHTGTTDSQQPPALSANAGAQESTSRKLADGTVIHVEPDPPKRPPNAVTCAKYGDFYAQAAHEPGVSPVKAQQLRDTALKAYQQALQIDPKYLPGYRSLANLYWDLNDGTHAAQMYQKALQLYPKDASLWADLGLGLFRQKDFAGGLGALGKAVALEPENREYSNAYGYALARAGQYDQALVVFMRHNEPAKAHFNLARMLAHLGQPDLSLQQVRMALSQNPNLSEARALQAELEGRAPPGNEGIRPASATQGPQPVPPVQPVVFLDSATPVETVPPRDAGVQQLPAPPMMSSGRP
jgi:tetratricopeptide (TPR) repeat protein